PASTAFADIKAVTKDVASTKPRPKLVVSTSNPPDSVRTGWSLLRLNASRASRARATERLPRVESSGGRLRAVPKEILDDRRIRERRPVVQIAPVGPRDLAQDPAHDLARARLR